MSRWALFTCCVLWVAAGYRVIVAVRRPKTWRTALAVAIGGVAAAATGHFLRERIDAALQTPNVTNLGSRIALCVAVVAAQLYLLDTRAPDASGRRRWTIWLTGLAAASISVISWVLAPIHTVELPDLAAAPAHPASLTYAATIYVYVSWFLIDLTRYAHQSIAEARETDPPAAAAIAFIGAAGWTGVPVLALFALHNALSQTQGRPEPYLDGVANLMFPVPLVLLSAGLLMLPLLSVLAHRRAAVRRTATLSPLWETLLAQHPHLHLPLAWSRPRRRLTPQFVAQRQLIEISDALEERRMRPVDTMPELATVLQEAPGDPTADDPTAKDVLLALDSAPWPDPVLHLSDILTAQKGSKGT